MNKWYILPLLLALTTATYAVEKPIVFRGDTLQLNNDFKRYQKGTAPVASMPEISGMACSRVTPGFLWVQSDDNNYVVALKPSSGVATPRLTLKLSNIPRNWDWEDMCIGQYQGKSTIFVGAFGDNSLQSKDNYYILYLDEPEIPETATTKTKLINKHYIHYGYPDNKAHDAEAMMYDNVDQVLYIIDKSDHGVCTVYKLPMDTVYPTDLQRPTEVCQLGIAGETQFCRVTAADMTPDGSWIIIKNYDVYAEKAYALIWQRHQGESVDEALQRQPQQIAAYELEWQGEALAWLDNTTFYTTSDENEDNPPIYRYVRKEPSGIEETSTSSTSTDQPTKLYFNGHLYILTSDGIYTLSGQTR